MEEYASNAYTDKTVAKKATTTKEEPVPDGKKVESVVTGEVVRRKKPLGKRFVETFLGGDAKSVAGYVIMDVLVPAAKDAVADAFSQGIERMLFGEARSTSRRTGNRAGSGYVSYNRFAQANRREDPRERERDLSHRARSQHEFDEIVLATRAEAETVIDRLYDLVERYEQATVADLYDLVSISGKYTDDKWGWTNLRGAGVRRVRNGYLLDLPKTEPLTDR